MPYGGNEINMSRKSPVPPSTTCTYSVYTPAPSEISVNRRWLNRIQEWTDEVPAGAEVTSSSSRPTTPASTPRSRFERHDSGKSLVSAVTTSSTVVPDDSISTRPTPMSKARQLPRDIPVQVMPGRSQLERLEPAKAAEIAREGDFRQTRPAQPAAYNDPRRTSYRSLVLDPISLTRTRLESPEITDRRHSDNRMTGRRSTYDSTIVPDDRFVRYSPTQLDYPSRSSQSRVLSPLGNERRPSQAELVKQEYRMSHEPSEEPNRPPTVRMDSGVSRSDSTRAPSPSYVMKAAHSHAPPPLPPKDASAAQYWTESHIKRLSEKAHPGGTRAGGKRDSWETTSVIDHRQERRVEIDSLADRMSKLVTDVRPRKRYPDPLKDSADRLHLSELESEMQAPKTSGRAPVKSTEEVFPTPKSLRGTASTALRRSVESSSSAEVSEDFNQAQQKPQSKEKASASTERVEMAHRAPTIHVTKPEATRSSTRSSISAAHIQLSSGPLFRASSQLSSSTIDKSESRKDVRTRTKTKVASAENSGKGSPDLVLDPHYTPDPAREQGRRPISTSSWSTADSELRDSLRRDSRGASDKSSPQLAPATSATSSGAQRELLLESRHLQRRMQSPQARPYTEPSTQADSRDLDDRDKWPGMAQRPFTLGVPLQRQMSPPISHNRPTRFQPFLSFRPGPPSIQQSFAPSQGFSPQGMAFPLASPPLSYASSASHWIPPPMTPPTPGGSQILPPPDLASRHPGPPMGMVGSGGFFQGMRPFGHEQIQHGPPFAQGFGPGPMQSGSAGGLSQPGQQVWHPPFNGLGHVQDAPGPMRRSQTAAPARRGGARRRAGDGVYASARASRERTGVTRTGRARPVGASQGLSSRTRSARQPVATAVPLWRRLLPGGAASQPQKRRRK